MGLLAGSRLTPSQGKGVGIAVFLGLFREFQFFAIAV